MIYENKLGFKNFNFLDSEQKDYKYKDDDGDREINLFDDTSNKSSLLTLGVTSTKQDNTLLDK